MKHSVKCLIWDLDNTLWNGVILEERVELKPGIPEVVKELDRRGIIQSIASRGEYETAIGNLRKHQLDEYFIVPQINWEPKYKSIRRIFSALNISPSHTAFIDDDPYEREQIIFTIPEILIYNAADAPLLPELPEFTPEEITREASMRRQLYTAELERKKAESENTSRMEFLLSCSMKLRIRKAGTDDLGRVAELMSRTHQLNTTGLMISNNQLKGFLAGNEKEIIVAELEDRFGEYGIIASAVYETTENTWRLNYLAVSCRVMGRGIERAILASLVTQAVNKGFREIEAGFRDTGKNRMMKALYQMSGFRKSGEKNTDGIDLFILSDSNHSAIPAWVEVL